MWRMHIGNQTFVPAPRAFRNGVHRLRKLAVIEKTPSFYDSIMYSDKRKTGTFVPGNFGDFYRIDRGKMVKFCHQFPFISAFRDKKI